MASQAAADAFQSRPELPHESSRQTISAEQQGRRRLPGAFLIELSQIEPDPDQPRKHFDEEPLRELAESIQAGQVKETITVCWNPASHKYRIIDGERRYRAAKLAGLNEVPCVVRDLGAKDALVDQIVHNWQRQDLRPYEMADALVRLKNDHGMTATDIAKVTGKSLAEVTKLIALVEKVVPGVQQKVRELADTSLTKRHLYALTKLEPDQQLQFAERIEREELTAIDTEQLVKRSTARRSSAERDARKQGRPRKHVQLSTSLGTVRLTPSEPYFTDDTLAGMLKEALLQYRT